MAEEELATFIDTFLGELSRKHGVSTPGWRFAAMPIPIGLLGGKYIPPTSLILVNRDFIYYYRVNRVLTEDIIKFILAHEFYHHIVMGGLSGMPLAKLLARLKKREHQRKADIFAQFETGIFPHMISTHLFALRTLAGEL